MAHYLVTGGCGFIGSHLVSALAKVGHQIRILDNLSSGHRASVPANVELLVADVRDLDAVTAALNGIDGIFHLAAVSSVQRCNDELIEAHQTNVSGFVTVIDAVRKVPGGRVPIVYASSAAVYGRQQRIPLSELDQPSPLTPYGVDKLSCELHATAAAHIYNIRSTGLRFFNVYGPRRGPEIWGGDVVSIFCRALVNRSELRIFGDGHQVRDFVYVSEAIRAAICAMDRQVCGASVFNVCTGKGTSIAELARILSEDEKYETKIKYSKPLSGDIEMSVGDPTLFTTEFGVFSEITPRTGMQLMLSAGIDFAEASLT